MDFDKKTIMAFLLIGLILVLAQTPIYQKIFMPEAYRARQLKKQQVAAERVLTKDLANMGAKEKVKQPEPESNIVKSKIEKPIVKGLPSEENLFPDLANALPEKKFTIETDLYKATLSTKGASLIQWFLKKYPGPDGGPVEMLPNNAYGTLGLNFITDNGDTLSTSDLMFKADAVTSVKLEREKSQIYRFTLNFGNDRKIVKEYQFFKDRYDFSLKVSLENMQDIISEKRYFLVAPSGLKSTEKRLRDDMYYTKAAVLASGEISKKFKTDGKLRVETGDIDWVAARTKYFALVMVPKTHKGLSAQVVGREIPVPYDKKNKLKKYSIGLAMPYLGQGLTQDTFMIYFGPLDLGIVKSYGIGLDKMMDFGFSVIQPFSKAILWSFIKLHTFIPNYGLVLILFSILIKLLVYPLTHKSFQSMKRMQELQPKLSALKEKYGKDAQRLNKETMKLYKEEKVNPMGSCLPTVLQMPLLWGLFIVFRSTIELRGQGFIWWIKDLSMPDTVATLPFSIPFYGDTVNILPLFMGIT
ncbi:MAG: membrane protein insertase YidC, partial [Calditrichaeota bacterium]|nr:membrane protein insertase YidC [Calditrichota bacterium]